jgi:hypothetical protein
LEAANHDVITLCVQGTSQHLYATEATTVLPFNHVTLNDHVYADDSNHHFCITDLKNNSFYLASNHKQFVQLPNTPQDGWVARLVDSVQLATRFTCELIPNSDLVRLSTNNQSLGNAVLVLSKVA